jgi:hypothetical protein
MVAKPRKMTKTEAEQFRHRLGYLRTWIQGFEAAGGKGPYDSDVLRQLQIRLTELTEHTA